MLSDPKDTDKSAIMAVIARETDTFVVRDFQGWSDCWVQDSRTCEVCMSTSLGANVLEGWEQISAQMQKVMVDGLTCEILDFERHDIDITISGHLAHVVFYGRSTHQNGRIERTFETRVMERDAGQWRILHSSFMLMGHQAVDAEKLALDAKGNVLCAPKIALERIEHHPGLTISNNRIRAIRSEWDKTLREGLEAAAARHGYFQHYRYMSQSGRNFRLPIVLGETDEGGVAVCVLFVRDGMTFLETVQESDLEDRMNVAKAIYGLSEAQMILAQRIVGGEDLPSASEAMGITINTARTHLSRIYAKTGINSQTALVRTLLSVG